MLTIVNYNLQYGARVKSYAGYLRIDRYFRSNKETIPEVSKKLQLCEPDVVGLVEVDNGSWRTKKNSQIRRIAKILDLPYIYSTCKYNALLRRLPMFRHQHHAFLSKYPIKNPRVYTFKQGTKRAILIAEIKGITLMLTHLSLRAHIRRKQVREIVELLKTISTPVIVMGDFNSQPESRELQYLMTEAKISHIELANTFPSWNPKKQFDHFFVSPELLVQQSTVIDMTESDHLPVMIKI